MSKKIKKEKITLKEAIERIPHNECYCNDSGRCPYWRLRNLTRTKMIRIAKSKEWFGIPSWYYRHNQLEYCVFLKDWLYIQDGCKDCGINEDITEDQKWIDPEHPNDRCYSSIPYRRRIKNREAADMYKEMFPEESDLIDKIVKEDNLTY